MAKQCGPAYLQCTWDDLTFYKMGNQYFVRKKSSLTREQVLKDPAFVNTRFFANRLAVASKIASSIYRSLPVHWRKFWMYRSFTGIATTMMSKGSSPQQTHDYLWKTYAEYWELHQQTSGIKLETGPPKQAFRRRKDYTTRLKHRNSNPQCRNYRRILGPNHWKSSYNNIAELIEKERKRIAQEKKLQWAAQQKRSKHWAMEKARWRHLLAQYPKPPLQHVA
jgi:hypothetical protein